MKLKLAARKKESPGVESFIFKPEKPLVWKAGQFLHYVLNHSSTDDRGSDRWFTIASAPCEKHVMITTRFDSKRSSTFKKTLKALKPGDTIEISDLDGDFIGRSKLCTRSPKLSLYDRPSMPPNFRVPRKAASSSRNVSSPCPRTAKST